MPSTAQISVTEYREGAFTMGRSAFIVYPCYYATTIYLLRRHSVGQVLAAELPRKLPEGRGLLSRIPPLLAYLHRAQLIFYRARFGNSLNLSNFAVHIILLCNNVV